MKNPQKAIWTAALAAGAGLIGATVLLFRFPARVARAPAGPSSALRLGPGQGGAEDPLFDDEAALRDPTPLFLPTERNSSQKDKLREEGEGAFLRYLPQYLFRLDRLRLNLPAPVAVPAQPAEALEQNPPGHPFLGMGRADGRGPPLPPRSLFVAITPVGGGHPVLEEEVSGLPPGIADLPPAGSGAWEFLAAVDPAGLVGPLLETVRSGTPADDYFLRYLTENLCVGLRLSPGFYRISVGP